MRCDRSEVSPIFSIDLSLTLSVQTVGVVTSFLSVFDVLRMRSDLLERFTEFFPDMIHAEGSGPVTDLSSNSFDLLFAEPVFLTAGGAVEFILKPSDRYLEFVAAITRDGDVSADFDLHSWPILVLRGDSAQPTIAEGGAAGHPDLDSCCRRTTGGPR